MLVKRDSVPESVVEFSGANPDATCGMRRARHPGLVASIRRRLPPTEGGPESESDLPVRRLSFIIRSSSAVARSCRAWICALKGGGRLSASSFPLQLVLRFGPEKSEEHWHDLSVGRGGGHRDHQRDIGREVKTLRLVSDRFAERQLGSEAQVVRRRNPCGSYIRCW